MQLVAIKDLRCCVRPRYYDKQGYKLLSFPFQTKPIWFLCNQDNGLSHQFGCSVTRIIGYHINAVVL
jgi:hypothetical protein